MQPVLSVRFYKSKAGTEPGRDWLRALASEARKIIGEDIKTVQFGWPLGMPLVRKLEAGLWEIRSHILGGIARVMFTTSGSTLVLLHGFVKKSNSTPAAELKTARKRKSEVDNG
jgi:phage-related protein